MRLAILLLAAASLLQSGAPNAAPASPSLESARARWERFTPEQKERARARYEQFLALSEEEREQLRESARRLRERTERVEHELAPQDGARLARMEPEKRAALVREIVVDESRAVGARVRSQLPEALLKRLENARPEDRARFFRDFRLQQQSRVARYAIGSLGKELGLPAEEITRMQELPGPGRCEAVLDLRKRLSEKDVRISGLPPGITEEQWDAWLELPPERFFEVFERNRASRILARERAVLLEASKVRPEELIALSDLSPEERQARTQAVRRERCTRALREGSLLPRGELEALEKEPDARYFATIRRLLWMPPGIPGLRRPGSQQRR